MYLMTSIDQSRPCFLFSSATPDERDRALNEQAPDWSSEDLQGYKTCWTHRLRWRMAGADEELSSLKSLLARGEADRRFHRLVDGCEGLAGLDCVLVQDVRVAKLVILGSSLLKDGSCCSCSGERA